MAGGAICFPLSKGLSALMAFVLLLVGAKEIETNALSGRSQIRYCPTRYQAK
jgi:hypothetical protein